MLRIPTDTLVSKNVVATQTGFTTFTLPFSDYSGLVAKFVCASFASGEAPGVATLQVYVQTTDDGGATFYDVANIICTQTASNANAIWTTLPVDGGDGKYVGLATGTTIANGSVSGLPLLSNLIRLNYVYTSFQATSLANWTLNLVAANQSAHA